MDQQAIQVQRDLTVLQGDRERQEPTANPVILGLQEKTDTTAHQDLKEMQEHLVILADQEKRALLVHQALLVTLENPDLLDRLVNLDLLEPLATPAQLVRSALLEHQDTSYLQLLLVQLELQGLMASPVTMALPVDLGQREMLAFLVPPASLEKTVKMATTELLVDPDQSDPSDQLAHRVTLER